MRKQSEIARLEEKILAWLDEAWDDYSNGESEFILGKIYAYIEILEDLLITEGVSDEALLDLERQYGVR